MSSFLAILRYLLLSPPLSWSIRGLHADMDETFAEMTRMDSSIANARANRALFGAVDELQRERDELESRYAALSRELDAREERYEKLRLAAVRALEGDAP